VGDECTLGPCPDGESCEWNGLYMQCKVHGCEYQVHAVTDSCTDVSNQNVSADGYGPSEEVAQAYAEASLQQWTCEGSESGCCEFSYSVVATVCY
jgi:hypothetical protein